MSRPNFHQKVRKEKERARKARQEEKQQRRSARQNTAQDASGEGGPAESAVLQDTTSETPS